LVVTQARRDVVKMKTDYNHRSKLISSFTSKLAVTDLKKVEDSAVSVKGWANGEDGNNKPTGYLRWGMYDCPDCSSGAIVHDVVIPFGVCIPNVAYLMGIHSNYAMYTEHMESSSGFKRVKGVGYDDRRCETMVSGSSTTGSVPLSCNNGMKAGWHSERPDHPWGLLLKYFAGDNCQGSHAVGEWFADNACVPVPTDASDFWENHFDWNDSKPLWLGSPDNDDPAIMVDCGCAVVRFYGDAFCCGNGMEESLHDAFALGACENLWANPLINWPQQTRKLGSAAPPMDSSPAGVPAITCEMRFSGSCTGDRPEGGYRASSTKLRTLAKKL